MFFQPYYSQITAPISFSLQQTGFYSPDIRKRRSAKRFRCRLNFDNASYPLLYDHCYRELHWLEQIPREHRRLFRFPLFSKNLQIEKYSLEFQDKKKKEKKNRYLGENLSLAKFHEVFLFDENCETRPYLINFEQMYLIRVSDSRRLTFRNFILYPFDEDLKMMRLKTRQES